MVVVVFFGEVLVLCSASFQSASASRSFARSDLLKSVAFGCPDKVLLLHKQFAEDFIVFVASRFFSLSADWCVVSARYPHKCFQCLRVFFLFALFCTIQALTRSIFAFHALKPTRRLNNNPKKSTSPATSHRHKHFRSALWPSAHIQMTKRPGNILLFHGSGDIVWFKCQSNRTAGWFGAIPFTAQLVGSIRHL